MFKLLKKIIKWTFILFIVAVVISPFLPSEPEETNKNGANLDTTLSKSWPASEWPLTVPSGTLRCLDDGVDSVVLEVGDTTFAVNGSADSRGYEDITSIWKDNPDDFGGPKVNISPLINFGLELCESGRSFIVSSQ